MPINTQNNLQSDVELALEKQKQQDRIDEINTQLSQLSQRYRVEKSYFGKLATWYSQLSWWVTLSVAALCVGIGGLIGFLINPVVLIIPLIGSISGLLVYGVNSLILWQHHRADKKYKDTLLSEITRMEKILSEAIALFNAIEKPMQDVLSSLEQKNTEVQAGTDLLQAAVAPITEQVNEVDDALAALSTNLNLLNNNNQSLDHLVVTSHGVNAGIHQHQSELSQINQGLHDTQQLLSNSVRTFSHLSREIASSTLDIDRIDEAYRALEVQTRVNQITLANHIAQLSQPDHQHTHASGKNSQQIVEDAMQALEGLVTRNRNRFFTGANDLNPASSDQSFRMQ